MPASTPSLVIDRIGRLVTCVQTGHGTRNPLGIIENAAITIEGSHISALGPRDAVIPTRGWPRGVQVLDAAHRAVLPGLVDCHTHLCFGGDRRHEYQERRLGVSYEAIAARGGGILSTVTATRQALQDDPDSLVERMKGYLDQMLLHGTTTAEVKSGYGLSTEAEVAMLRLYRDINARHPIDLIPTFLGAHQTPPDYRTPDDRGRRRYVDLLCEEMLPVVASEGLAEFCDVFCERDVFTAGESERILRRGLDLGLKPKLHCDQFHAIGGIKVAAALRATSVDHLHVTPPSAVEPLAAAGTVAVGLPGVTYFLGLEDATPWRALHEAGVPMALATDFNPGTSMTNNLQIIASIASSRWRMPDELILPAITREAARAVGRQDSLGSLAPGRPADLIILDSSHEGVLTYHFGVNHVDTVIKGGRIHVRGGCRV